MLPGESADKPPAADLAPRLEPPIDAQDVAPRREQGLTLYQPPKHHAVPPQQLPGNRLGNLSFGNRWLAARPGPPARGLDPERGDPATAPIATPERPAAIRRHEQGAESREAVGRNEAPRDQLGESLLHFGPQQPRRVHEIAEEQRAARVERREQRLSGG